MIQQFINREEELRFLEERYQSKKSEFIIIYGRRRIGKTELVSFFMRNKPSIYVLATYRPVQETLRELQNKMAKLLQAPRFSQLNITHFDELFEAFVELLNTTNAKLEDKKNKMVICIDEFPILIQRDKSIPFVFQRIWDEYIKDRNDIMLILMGSSISMMETDVLGYKSPLYGRRTGQWLVTEFKIHTLKEYFVEYSLEDIVRTYSVTGGIPGYITQFDPSIPLKENIIKNILTKGAYLYDEPEVLMRAELRDPTNYFSILKAIASGNRSFGKIVDATHLDKSIVSKYLAVLQNLRIIEREIPVLSSTKTKMGTKGGLYRITDNFFTFWFNYVYPFKSELEAGNVASVMEHINRTFNEYVGTVYERLILSPYIATKIVPFLYTDIGRWWFRDKEIDLVAVNQTTNKIFFGEVKWRKVTIKEIYKLIEQLREKAEFVSWKEGKREEYYGVIVREIKDIDISQEFTSERTKIYTLRNILSANLE